MPLTTTVHTGHCTTHSHSKGITHGAVWMEPQGFCNAQPVQPWAAAMLYSHAYSTPTAPMGLQIKLIWALPDPVPAYPSKFLSPVLTTIYTVII